MPRDAPAASSAPLANPETGCLPRGYRLRDFVIEQVLAEGGFGVVYAAIDLRLQRRVAIKEYMPAALARRAGDLSVQPRSSVPLQDAFATGLRSFINEAQLLAGFDHPALVRVLQFWEDKGTGFMVMPLYQAPTVRQWTLARPQRPDAVWLLAFLDQLLEALALVHGAACLHRDIAPDNILLQRGESPLLLDFGAARRVVEALTQTLTVIVKPGFAPVEQYAQTAGLRQGPWTDLYALCATVHFMLTRRAPPPAVGRMADDDYLPLATALGGCYPSALLQALDAGLAVHPADRPQSVAEFRALLHAGEAADGVQRDVALPPARSALLQQASASAFERREFMPTVSASIAAHRLSDGVAPDAVVAAGPAKPSLADVLLRRPLAPRTVMATLVLATLASGAGVWMNGDVVVRAAAVVPSARVDVPDAMPIAIQRADQPAPEGLAPAGTDESVRRPAKVSSTRTAAPAAPSAQRLAELARLRAAAARPAAAAAASRTSASTIASLPAPMSVPPTARSPGVAVQATAAMPPAAVPRAVALVMSGAAPEKAVSSAGRSAVEPASLVMAELQPLARPQPLFPAEAARDGIDSGRVVARLQVTADGRVGRVDIVESTPRRTFDREVRLAAQQWRYQPPGQPREVSVEFVFRRDS